MLISGNLSGLFADDTFIPGVSIVVKMSGSIHCARIALATSENKAATISLTNALLRQARATQVDGVISATITSISTAIIPIRSIRKDNRYRESM